MKSILVTGAAGFIGSHLCEALLKAGEKVIGIDNFDPFYNPLIKQRNLQSLKGDPHFVFIEGDAGDTALLARISQPIDLVVHLAAKPGVLPSIKNPLAYIDGNIRVTNCLLEWMKERPVKKLVFASSSSVYGNNNKIPFDEEDKVSFPISPYALTKKSCELMNHIYHSLYQMDIVNLRFFTVYGERQRPDLAIHKFVRMIFEGKPVTVYGDGKTARDYTYYSDTVSGIMAAIDFVHTQENVYETINLGNHHPVFLIDLVQTIATVAGKPLHLVYEDMKPGDVNITYAKIDKARRLLGYQPQFEMEQGIKNFIDWYKGVNNLK
jgi:UDP-glucuronate 4-epimerase